MGILDKLIRASGTYKNLENENKKLRKRKEEGGRDVTLTIRLPQSLKDKLQKEAADNGVSVADVANELLSKPFK